MTKTASQQSKEVAPPPAATLPVEATEHLGLSQLFSFSSFTEAYTAAEKICKTAMVPKHFQGNPAEIIAAWQYGLELGLPPMQALTAIAIINGRPGLYGDGFLAVIRAHDSFGDCIETWDDETKTATCIMRRKGKLDVVRTFSFEDAKIAGLLNKEGPWRTYPKRMCQMRARGFAGRDQFADVLRGMAIGEELDDLPAEREVAGEVVRQPGETKSRTLLNQLKPDAAKETDVAATESTEASAPASSGPTVDELLEQVGKATTFDQVNEVIDLARSMDPEAKQKVGAAARARIKELKGAA
jgi:hypothetical protein